MTFYLKNVATGNQYALAGMKVTMATESQVDTSELELERSVRDNFEIGNTIKILDGSTERFSGYLYTHKFGTKFTPVCESLGGELRRTMANEVYENKSPEYIVEALLTKYTSLTYAGTWTSGLIIEKVSIPHRYISDVIAKICELFNCQFRTDKDGNAYLEDRGTATCSADALVVGTNCIIKNEWERDPDKVINFVVIKGGNETHNYHEAFAGPNTEFTLSKKPTGGVRVTTSSGANELTGNMQGDIGGDYYVDDEEQKVVLASSASNVDIYYDYSLAIEYPKTNLSSIDEYGMRGAKITASWITKLEDAKTFANTLLSQYSTPPKSNCIVKAGLDWAYVAGAMISVTDSENGITSESMYIRKVVWNLKENMTYIYVGTEKYTFANWTKNLQNAVNDFMDFFGKASTIQQYITAIIDLDISVDLNVTVSTRTIGNTFILDHPTNSKLDGTHQLSWVGGSWTPV